MKFIIPDSLYRIQLDPVEEASDLLNVTVILNDTFKTWASEHNITDYEVDVEPEEMKFYVKFGSDASGMMFRLSWSDQN